MERKKEDIFLPSPVAGSDLVGACVWVLITGWSFPGLVWFEVEGEGKVGEVWP